MLVHTHPNRLDKKIKHLFQMHHLQPVTIQLNAHGVMRNLVTQTNAELRRAFTTRRYVLRVIQSHRKRINECIFDTRLHINTNLIQLLCTVQTQMKLWNSIVCTVPGVGGERYMPKKIKCRVTSFGCQPHLSKVYTELYGTAQDNCSFSLGNKYLDMKTKGTCFLHRLFR